MTTPNTPKMYASPYPTVTADSNSPSAEAFAAEKAGVDVNAPANIPTIIAENSSEFFAEFFPI